MSLVSPLKTTLCIVSMKGMLGRVFAFFCYFGLFSIIGGCATGPTKYAKQTLSAEQQGIINSKPVELQSQYRALFEEGRRNEVLNLMEIGAIAFKNEYFDEAKRALDEAILNISSVYADNEAAKNARSLWYEEGQKDFKGEPYERSMAFYYRGLLYLRDGDFDNAHASFLNGILQDAFAEEEQNRSDFAVFLYLAGWSALQMGLLDKASEHFKEFASFRPDIPIPDSDDNVLVVAETGTSPRKLADGVGHYQMVFRRGKKFKENEARLVYEGQSFEVPPVEDVFFQASTRGGREVDKIIKGQVSFKKTSGNIGSTISNVVNNDVMAGVASLNGNAGSNVFVGVTAISVAALAISASTVVRADTRYWSTLPNRIHITTLSAGDPAAKRIQGQFITKNGQVLPALIDESNIYFNEKNIGFAYLSSRR